MNPVYRTLSAVLFSAALAYAGNGLQGMILPLRGAEEGFSTFVLGLLGSTYALGFMAGCVFCPRIIRRVGHIRALTVFAAVSANTVLLYVLFPDPLVWLFVRVVGGASLAGMFLVIESWLNETSDNSIRGQVFSIYMIINYSSVTTGQMMVSLGDPGDFKLFALACMGLAAALIPVGLTRMIGPAPLQTVQIRLLHLFRISPIGAVGALLVGFCSGIFGSLGVVFVDSIGFSSTQAAIFISAAIVGAALFQMPSGWLSDRIDRRLVILGLAAISSLVGIALFLSDGNGPASSLAARIGLSVPWTWTLAALVFGAFAYPLYGICVAHVNDHVSPEGYVEASGGILMIWGAGAALGPFAASLVMETIGANGLFLATALAHGSLALFAVLRMVQRTAPSAEEKDPWMLTPLARTTLAAVMLDPRSDGEIRNDETEEPTPGADSGGA